MGMYTANLTPHIYAVSIDTVADGDYEFDVGDMYEPLPFLLDGSYFVDGAGGQVVPSAGSVTCTVSTNGIVFRDVFDGTFAATTDPVSITPPSGQAPITKIRVTLTGVLGASGFRANFVKGGE